MKKSCVEAAQLLEKNNKKYKMVSAWILGNAAKEKENLSHSTPLYFNLSLTVQGFLLLDGNISNFRY